MTATTHRVSGMTCDGCARAVANTIREEAPGAEVAVDLAAGTVRVAGADDAAVRMAVDAAGFTYDGAAH